MATVNFLYRSKKSYAPLTVRLLFRHDNVDHVFGCRSEIFVEKSVFDLLKSKSRDAEVRHLQTQLMGRLDPLQQHIIKAFNGISPDEVDKQWLQFVVNEFHNPEPEKDDRVVHWIKNIIDGANTRDNSKGGIGLSKGRVTSWKRLLDLFKEYSKSKKYKVHEMNVMRFKDFRNWLINDMEYSATYATKKLSDLKTAIREAKGEGIEVSADFDKLPTKQTSAYDDDMDVITLSEKEIESIENLELENEALINARKWLILACYTGQRGEVLTKRLIEDSFVKRGSDLVIRIVQKKGNKPVQIPVLPKVREIYDNGLPYTLSTQKLNQHFKTLGRLAGINQQVMGRLEEYDNPKGKRGVKKMRMKWEYISTHIGRRTFATNHYGEIPTPIIMAVTGHKKEATFLRYINKSDDSHIDTFLGYYQKKELKKRKEPQLEIVKSKSN